MTPSLKVTVLGDIAFQVKHLVEEPDLIADVLIEQLGAPRFSWGGSSSLVNLPALRQDCIAALRQADRGDLSALLTFARKQ